MEIHFQQQNQPAQHQKSSKLLSVSKGCKFKRRNKKNSNNNDNKVNKFVGVRQRTSGRWVAEIKDTTQKIRMWLGTFETAEEAARAYDEAACLLRGSNTRTNFVTKASSSDSTLAYRIRNLLNRKKGVKQQQQSGVVSVVPSRSCTISFSPNPSSSGLSNEKFSLTGMVQDAQLFVDAYKPDMSNCSRELGFDTDFTHISSELGFDRFLHSQEIMGLPTNLLSPEETGYELTQFQKMKVERQISTSLYAMNGIQEYMETVNDSAENLWDLPALCSLFN
ncbi:hypothetical protein V6N13_131475 [Hibiscus sabdariffa]|uniref:AP2/ERF domain-containing protein n=2 Tax=Hibiscus sabdariffa TaxID=183260 RepID=A0ABR1ZAU3_9ROSI